MSTVIDGGRRARDHISNKKERTTKSAMVHYSVDFFSVADDRPTPLDFDTFIPWACVKLQVFDQVQVTSKVQEEYVSVVPLKRKIVKSKLLIAPQAKLQTEADAVLNSAAKIKSYIETSTVSRPARRAERAVPLTTCYDSLGHLVEIAINSSPIAIHRKIIKAINLCLPFHKFLNRLTITKGGVTAGLIHEVGNLLPHSYITEVFLDGHFVKEGNFYLLLDRDSKLKYLSLNRCSINDVACIEIAKRIDYGQPAANTLKILDLCSNFIGDLGAKSFGDSLRRNRCLLHLNLSGNKISDDGASYILRHLKAFPLTETEIVESKSRKIIYLKQRNEMLEKCIREQLAIREQFRTIHVSTLDKTSSTKRSKPTQKPKSSPDLTEIAQMMTSRILATEFTDVFDSEHLIVKNNSLYSTGNLTLCSINFSYNNLDIFSLKNALEVLKYQSQKINPPQDTGLLRLGLDGNNIPTNCFELGGIHLFLRNAILMNTPIETSRISHSGSTKKGK